MNNTRRFNIFFKIAAMIFFIAAPFIAAALLSMISNGSLETVRYEIKSAKLNGASIRLVMISDLHRRKLDETNQRVVDAAALEAPDIIVVNGDMLERDCTDDEVEAFAFLLERLVSIAPVYFSVGNHDFRAFFSEYELGEKGEYLRGIKASSVVSRLESTGARFLERDQVDVELNGASLRFGGLYAIAYENELYSERQQLPISSFLSDFCDTERYTVMLSHRPKSFVLNRSGEHWDIDLVLCGHTHNGVIALPFGLGALWASSSFFPKYDRGLYELGGGELIIGAGIDGYMGVIPRIFNPPEIVTVDILPEG